MKKDKNIIRTSKALPHESYLINLAIMVIFFICGTVAGCILTANSAPFPEVFDELLVSESSKAYSFIPSFFNIFKYPLLVFVLAFTAFGVFIIPACVAAKGFFLSCSVTAAYSASKSIAVPLSLFGIQSFASIPCLLVISIFAFEISKTFFSFLLKQKKKSSAKQISIGSYFLILLFLIIAAGLCALLDIALTPKLVSVFVKN